MSKAKACVGYTVFKYFDVEVDDDGGLTDKGEEALYEESGISLCFYCCGHGRSWSIEPPMGGPIYVEVGDVIEEDVIGSLREARNVAVQERDEARARLEEAQRIAAELRAELMQRGKGGEHG